MEEIHHDARNAACCRSPRQLDTLPAATLNDLRARLDWMDWRNALETAPDPKDEAVRLATLRADIERMGERIRDYDAETVQSGQAEGYSPNEYTLRSPISGTSNDPVRSGHPRRTNADKRQDVMAMLAGSEGLTDREVARRAGVSPTTVGAIRRAASLA